MPGKKVKTSKKSERKQAIKELLIRAHQVDVSFLCNALGVSAVTIRNDLNDLEEQGFLKRQHGRAILAAEEKDAQGNDTVLIDSQIKNDEIKKQIGVLAAQLVQTNEWIYLGEGSTCFYVACELAKLEGINVVTNSLYSALAFRNNPSINVIVTGGNLYHHRAALGGGVFTSFINGRNISKAIFGIAGIDLRAGFTQSNVDDDVIFEAVREVSKEIVIVTDNTKFDRVSFVSVCDLATPDVLITNAPMPEKYEKVFEKNHVKTVLTNA